MNLDDLTIGQAKELATLFAQGQTPVSSPSTEHFGHAVVVLDRGFVYVGDASRKGDFLELREGRNIRRWGTTQGLHQLVTSGPTKETLLDVPATVLVPMKAVISIHPSDSTKWR